MSVAVLGLVAAAVAVASPSNAAEVSRTIDGDTLVIRVDGHEEHVRLLNIDTPETKDPNSPVECLGPEASVFTHDLAPDGTKVTLAYDGERRDRYGRLLANVRLADGRSLSEEIARAGLGIPVLYGSNGAGMASVAAAFSEARQAETGFFDPERDCTVPAQYRAATVGLSPSAAAAPTTSSAAAAQVAATAAGLAAAREFQQALSHPASTLAWSAMSAADLRGLRVSLTSRLARRVVDLRNQEARAKSLKTAEVKARAARRAAAAARKAARQAAREAKAAAEAVRDARARAAAEARARTESSGGGSTEGGESSSSDPYPGYNGPRCYDPGGVTWHPC